MDREWQLLKSRLDRWEDTQALLWLKQRYARLCDDGYPAKEIADLFAPDGECDWGPEFALVKGRSEIEKYFARCATQFVSTLHYVINSELTISPGGSTAQGHWYLFKPCTAVEWDSGRKEAIWMGGTYEDEFVKLSGEWKIKRLKANISFSTPYESGWLKERFSELTKAPEPWRSPSRMTP